MSHVDVDFLLHYARKVDADQIDPVVLIQIDVRRPDLPRREGEIPLLHLVHHLPDRSREMPERWFRRSFKRHKDSVNGAAVIIGLRRGRGKGEKMTR